jgi:predicted aconitase with swiveling domain
MKILKGRVLVQGGIVEGEALVMRKPFNFERGVDFEEGTIKDERTGLAGRKIAGKVMVFPKLERAGSNDRGFLTCVINGNAPAAIINVEAYDKVQAFSDYFVASVDLALVYSSVIAKGLFNTVVPILDKMDENPLDAVKTGDYVKVDGRKGWVYIGT